MIANLNKLLPHRVGLLFLLVVSHAYGQPDQKYKLVDGANYVQSKNYYLLTLFQTQPEVRRLVEKDTTLARIANTTKAKLKQQIMLRDEQYHSTLASLKFSDDEIESVSARLRELTKREKAIQLLIREHLRRSGTYLLFGKLDDTELIVKAWRHDAAAVNHTIEVYGEGKKANYPSIDSIGFNTRRKEYPTLVYDCADVVVQQHVTDNLFFSLPMNMALELLEVNERNEASDFEPMIGGVNKAAYEHVRSIDWGKYKYAVILVPGAGPDTHDRALSEGGILRCRIAALRYREGIAPYIIVSGGRVHPYKTKYSEAYEMKKFLVEKLQLPEYAIIMDPHARHTTTNMRNAARLMFRYGIPFDKVSIVATVKSQSYYITNDNFVKRCETELGYLPYKLGKRLSDTEFEFFATLESLHIDDDEPLDP